MNKVEFVKPFAHKNDVYRHLSAILKHKYTLAPIPLAYIYTRLTIVSGYLWGEWMVFLCRTEIL